MAVREFTAGGLDVFDFLKIKQTISDLGKEIKRLRAERETLLRHREDLENAPPCREDIIDLVDAWVDKQSEGFAERLQQGLAYYLRHPLQTLPEQKGEGRGLAILTAVKDPNAVATLKQVEANLFALLGDLVKTGLRRAVDQMDFTDCGPLRAERLKLIQAIDAKVDALDAQEKELTEQAHSAGLRVTP